MNARLVLQRVALAEARLAMIGFLILSRLSASDFGRAFFLTAAILLAAGAFALARALRGMERAMLGDAP